MKTNKSSQKFWNKEYNQKIAEKSGRNLAISTKPSADLVQFLKWFDKNHTQNIAKVSLGKGSYVYDIGCGNGRNIIYLAKEFGMVGSGFDISREAIENAKKLSKEQNLDIVFNIHSMDGNIDLPDNSVHLVLDMMASHFLNEFQRKIFVKELARVIKPGGWLFYKTFLLEGDRNAKKLLKEYPCQNGERNTYIHPRMGVSEHVSTVDSIIDDYEKYFKIHKMVKSHNHIKNGRANKRRSISVYAENL